VMALHLPLYLQKVKKMHGARSGKWERIQYYAYRQWLTFQIIIMMQHPELPSDKVQSICCTDKLTTGLHSAIALFL
jgi:hypothetical protein